MVTRPPAPATGTPASICSEQANPGIKRSGSSSIVDRRLVEHRVLAVAIDPKAEAEHHAATGQAIDRCRRLSDELRPTSRQGGDHRADHDPLGRHRDRRKRDEWVGERNQRSVPEMIPDEHAVPTGLLRGERHVREQPGSAKSPDNEIDKPHRTAPPSVSPRQFPGCTEITAGAKLTRRHETLVESFENSLAVWPPSAGAGGKFFRWDP